MIPKIYRTQLHQTVRSGLIAASFLGISLLAACIPSFADSDMMFGLISQLSGFAVAIGALLLTRWVAGLYTYVRIDDTAISLHRLLKRPIRILYSDSVLVEKRLNDRVRCLDIAQLSGPVKKRKQIPVTSMLNDFDNLALLLKERVGKKSEDTVKESTLVELLSEGVTIKIHSAFRFLFSLFGVLAIFFSVMWMRQPGEMEKWSNIANAAGMFAIGVASLVSVLLFCRTLRFDAYGITMATFLHQVHIPWEKITSCAWTANRKKFLVRSVKTEINCTEVTARSKALMDLLTSYFPSSDVSHQLYLPFVIKTSWQVYLVVVLMTVSSLGIAGYSLPEMLTPPIIWTPGLIVRISFIFIMSIFICWYIFVMPLRYEFDSESIAVVKPASSKRHPTATILEINIDQSHELQGEPINALTIVFETEKIEINSAAVSFPLSFLHNELQRLYLGKDTTSIPSQKDAKYGTELPFLCKSPSPWPHGASIHWRGVGALALYWMLPVVLIGLGWLAISGSALDRAVKARDLPRIEQLLGNGANPNKGNLAGWTPMHDPQTPEILRLLLKHGGDINIESKMGAAPLLMACRDGDGKELIAAMIAAVADVNHNARRFVCSLPLQAAAYHGRTDIVVILIDAGARIEDCGRNGTTPIIEAAEGGNVETVHALIDRGADVNTRVLPAQFDKNEILGATALHYAARENQTAVAEALIKAGACVEAVTKEGWTPLHVAYDMNANETVALLIREGANQGAKTKNGYTPEMLKGKRTMKKRES